jgi:hypothetical protein
MWYSISIIRTDYTFGKLIFFNVINTFHGVISRSLSTKHCEAVLSDR